MPFHPRIQLSLILTAFATFTLGAHPALAAKARSQITKSGCAQGKPKAVLQASNGRGAEVHPVGLERFQCLLKGMEEIRYPLKYIGGYGCRPLPTSNHPRGLAVDLNQSSRDITNPNIYRWKATQVAAKCNLTHGAVWRNPDAGHFELRSQSRSQQQARRASAPTRTTSTYSEPSPRKRSAPPASRPSRESSGGSPDWAEKAFRGGQ